MYIIAKSINTSSKEAVFVVITEMGVNPSNIIPTIHATYDEIDSDFHINLHHRQHIPPSQVINRILNSTLYDYPRTSNVFKLSNNAHEHNITTKFGNSNMATINNSEISRIEFKYYSPSETKGNFQRSLSNSLLAGRLIDNKDGIIIFSDDDITKAQEIFTTVFPILKWLKEYRHIFRFYTSPVNDNADMTKLCITSSDDDYDTQVFNIDGRGVDHALKIIKIMSNNGENMNGITVELGA